MNEAGPSPNTIYKNELKMDYRPKYKTEHYKTHRRKHGAKLHDTGFGNHFLNMMPKAQATK